VSRERLSIAQVTPHPWGPYHEVNDFVERVAVELRRRGHRVLVAAPSDSRTAIRDSRKAIRAAAEKPSSIFDGDWARSKSLDSAGVLAVGQGIPMPRGPRPRAAPVPLDVSRTLEQLLTSVPLDIVHVHDPFAPSTSSTALRHSRSLNIGSFHEPTERLLSTQVARPLVEIFFGRLDARTVSCRATAELVERYFPGTYELIRPGADLPDAADVSPRGAGGGAADRPVRIVYCQREERGALRLFLRALRRLPLEPAWEAVVWADSLPEQAARVGKRLRDRVRLVGPSDGEPEAFIADADVLCAASGGSRVAPGLVRTALAAGAVPVASHLEIYEELLEDGELGLLFLPGDAITLAGQLSRLIEDRALRGRLARRAPGAARTWSQTADELEEMYRGLCSRRHDPNGKPEIRKRLSGRGFIHCDLHMHTDHSPDCATPVEVLLETARDRGLEAIAITDHNEISGALEAREAARSMDGIEVIVAEEVKTAEQGEVIGLFLEKKIPRGMSMAETIAEIRRQGGLVYVPHPFDRLHSVPDYEHLLEIVEEIDILEVFNPRVAFSAFNEEAERFAAKYRIVPGAGSDSHVAQGLGSVRIRLHDFDGPEEFLEAMRDADIVHKHKNLIYVQALKFLQTTGRPKGARRARATKPARPARGGKRRAARRR
jgi:predicted metal-dependent phosphoesterase TrpH/glycosyltransferase involved in cell wall biosynthesis